MSKNEPRPKVSVVIPTHRVGRDVEALIRSLVEQDYKPYEIILVYSGGQPDNETYKYVRLVRLEDDRGPNHARNIGFAESKGEIVAFIDGDCVAPRDWLFNLVKELLDTGVDAIAGTVEAVNRDKMLSRYQEHSLLKPIPRYFSRKILLGGIGLTLVVTANFGVRREAVVEIGGFDESYFRYGCDDIDFAVRLLKKGYKVLCSPLARVYHRNRDRLIPILRRFYYYGKGFSLFRIKHPKTSLSILVSLGSYALIFAHITAFIYALLNGFGAKVLIVPLSPIIIFALFQLYDLSRTKRRAAERMLYVFLDYLVSLSASIGILVMDLTLLKNLISSKVRSLRSRSTLENLK